MPYKFFILFYLFQATLTQPNLNCEGSEKCGECIRRVGCVWCLNPKYNENIHCKSEKAIIDLTSWCHPNELVNPQLEFNIIEDVDLNSGRDGSAVQIKPQKVRLNLRKDEEYSISLKYARASNYPLDLYYIMDLSHTMRNHKDKLSELGDQLVKVMQNSTTDFRLGFGSFVDKPVMPFTQTAPNYTYSACTDCVPTYSFKNHLSLSNDYERFSREVSNSKLSTNMDLPEGGFDALMQAMVCKEEIGWRDNARHLVVFSTDYLSHFAGDGKLGGLYEPNDANCHLVADEYVKLLDRDYPSMGQLEYVAKMNNIHLILAIPEVRRDFVDIFQAYEEISKSFENSRIGKLDNDSSNVVHLIRGTFEQITDSICITDDASPTVQIKYENSKSNDHACSDNIQMNEIITFNVTMKPLECPPDRNTPQYIKIKPEGLNETLLVELNVICDCDCEKLDSERVPDINDCGGKGRKICGVCDCFDGHYGNACECSADSIGSVDETNCRRDGNNATEICSGLGVCKCGTCVCAERPAPQLIYGRYCECDNYSCRRVKGELCSGVSKGKCACGKCECLSGWSGEDCGCSTSQSACVARTGDRGEICSGRGDCVCGECKCKRDDGNMYYGKYCEECPTCPGQRCEELLECIEITSNSSNRNTDDPLNCTKYDIKLVEELDETYLDMGAKICREIDQAGCTVTFKYTYGHNQRLTIEMLQEKSCPKTLDAMVIVGIIIFSIIVGGLIMLVIWKTLTHLQDTREYANFLKEMESRKWNAEINPLYKQASTTIMNPLFNMRNYED